MLWLYILDWCCLYRWIFSVFSKNCPPKHICVSISNSLWMCMLPSITYIYVHLYSVYVYRAAQAHRPLQNLSDGPRYKVESRVERSRAVQPNIMDSSTSGWSLRKRKVSIQGVFHADFSSTPQVRFFILKYETHLLKLCSD